MQKKTGSKYFKNFILFDEPNLIMNIDGERKRKIINQQIKTSKIVRISDKIVKRVK